MELKILHGADLHLDAPFGKFSGTERDGLRRALRSVPEKLLSLSREEGCDLWLLSGDVFDGECSYESYLALYRAIEDSGVPVFIAPGNHDFYSPSSLWATENWPENAYIFNGPMTSYEIGELNCRIYGAAFQGIDSPGLLEGFEARQDGMKNICVLHGDPTNPASPYSPITRQQVEQSGLDYLALGHIHLSGSFRAGETLCAWPGCPMGRGWDETGDKGVNIVTLGRRAGIERRVLDLPGFYELEADIEEDAAQALSRCLAPYGSQNHFRVTLTGTGKADVKQLLREFSEYPYLDLRDRTEPELPEETGTETFRGLYFSMLREREEKDGALAKLAADISRKILLGKEEILP